MTSLIDVVRVGHSTYSWSSVVFSVDGQPTEGLIGIDYDEQLEVRPVPSNTQDAPPLGFSRGGYRVGRFPIRLLRDSARALKAYLSAKAATSGLSSYGQAIFTAGLSLAGEDAGDFIASTTAFIDCRIVSERIIHDEGVDELVTELMIACIAIVQDETTLFNALSVPLNGFPSADTITLANAQAPGKWTLVSAPKVYGWDVRKGYGTSGATVVPVGDELVTAEFMVELWDPADYLLFKVFRSSFLKKPLIGVPGAPTSLALGIDHPELRELGVDSVVVKEINPLVGDAFGVWSTKVVFLQYRKPLPALSKPLAAIPDAAPPIPTAQTALEQQIAAASAELQALAK